MANNFDLELIGEIENSKDENIDVFVRFKNGEEYVVSFFTIENLKKLISKNRISGEQLSGLYFWSSDMIIIQEIDKDKMKLTIEDLLKTSDFYYAARAVNNLAEKRKISETKNQNIGVVFNPPIKIPKK